MLTEVIVAVAVLGGMGLLFGLGLAYTSRRFAVEAEERVAMIRQVLPGANCGACGLSGCDAFAEAVAAGKCPVDGCPVGGQKTATEIARILGVESKDVKRLVARVKCAGGNSRCGTKYKYNGIASCRAAASLYGGQKSCFYGCLGLGDCVRACQFEAIKIIDGVAVVDENKCTSCGKCVKACPKNLIELIPESCRFTVYCSSLDRGALVRKICSVGCIGCRLCVRSCPRKAISMVKEVLARIDPDLCDNCGECEKVCPTHSIRCSDTLALENKSQAG